MWRRDGSRIKYENRTATLELDPPSPREEYECYGNLTVAGFMFFRKHLKVLYFQSFSLNLSKTIIRS